MNKHLIGKHNSRFPFTYRAPFGRLRNRIGVIYCASVSRLSVGNLGRKSPAPPSQLVLSNIVPSNIYSITNSVQIMGFVNEKKGKDE